MLPDHDQEDLIERAVHDDRRALERLLLAHSRRLSRFIAQRLPESLQSIVGIDDILQQTYMQAFRDITNLKARNVAGFSAWLNQIAVHRVQDVMRGYQRKKRDGQRAADPAQTSSLVQLVELLSDRQDTPRRGAIRKEAIEAIQFGISGLPDDQQQAVRLHYLQSRTIQETATEMRRTPGAVRGLLHRAKQQLRDVLQRSSGWID